jgi:uncharacterized protein (TIGR02145 family)
MKQLLIFFSVMCAMNISAQVTIGKLAEPHTAAILDLSQKEDAAQDRGLLLPHVVLMNLDEFQLITPVSDEQKSKAEGMVVWNTGVGSYICPGVYLWSNDKWNPLTSCPTPISGALLTTPLINIVSAPECGSGAQFEVKATYPDLTDTEKFVWSVSPPVTGAVTSGDKDYQFFVPYDADSETYTVSVYAETKGTPGNSSSSSATATGGWCDLCSGPPTISNADQYSFMFTKGATQSLSVSADGNGDTDLSYQWQSSPTGSAPWSTASGTNTEASYAVPTNDDATMYYRCLVTNICGTTVSGTYTVRICSSVTDEGILYPAAAFGKAGCWMTQNLRSTTGLTRSSNTSTNTSRKYYWYPNNSQNILDSYPEYGLLYTWAAATGRTDVSDNEGNTVHTPPQGICPTGWHIPTDMEWTQLEEVIAKDNTRTYSTSLAAGWLDDYVTATGSRGEFGRKMKSATPVNGRVTGGTSHAWNANGFDALLLGHMENGAVDYYDEAAYFWSSSSNSGTDAWRRMQHYNTPSSARSPSFKYRMCSVRCKKDDN